MKVCVSLRNPAPKNLKEGNLRGEERWEFKVLEACVSSPLVEEIYTVGRGWAEGEKVTSKFKGHVNSNTAKDTILLIHDCNLNIITAHVYKAVVISVFSGPWLNEIDEVKKLFDFYGDNFIFTLGCKALFDNTSAKEHLLKFVPDDSIFLLPWPGVSRVDYEDRFKNKTIMWAWRVVFFDQLVSDAGLVWSLQKLKEDPSLNLCIITGWKEGEAKDLVNGEVIYIKEDINDYFWSKGSCKPYLDIRSRVTIKNDLSWDQILNMYTHAKLLPYYGKYLGGPGIEAAMCGVPFVGSSSIEGALVDCEDYLYSENADEAFKLMDRLLVDEEFYTKTSKAYSNFAIENYSYEVFCQNLQNILKGRGVL